MIGKEGTAKNQDTAVQPLITKPCSEAVLLLIADS
ncbi:hypothetical protein NIES806_09150 [Dolichospermum compactum NIES-806]|uniref:Uncharacterized protein n=1 Tax=Dolichospermum compactum NIES-806 TaxID=1973481 RepID=A0A1Z4UZX4_9CYAN|nr:hypothetical protein NIES806_09150 [Dolichospermum compactum NIES-806]